MIETLKITYGRYFIEVLEVPLDSIREVLLIASNHVRDGGLMEVANQLCLNGYKAKVWRVQEE